MFFYNLGIQKVRIFKPSFNWSGWIKKFSSLRFFLLEFDFKGFSTNAGDFDPFKKNYPCIGQTNSILFPLKHLTSTGNFVSSYFRMNSKLIIFGFSKMFSVLKKVSSKIVWGWNMRSMLLAKQLMHSKLWIWGLLIWTLVQLWIFSLHLKH